MDRKRLRILALVRSREASRSSLRRVSIICADKAYTDYDYEDLLEEIGLHLKAEAQEELQETAGSVGGVPGQADSPVYRNGL